MLTKTNITNTLTGCMHRIPFMSKDGAHEAMARCITTSAMGGSNI